MLSEDGVAILNVDDPAGRRMPVPRGRRIGYGTSKDADLRVQVLAMDAARTDVDVGWAGRRARLCLPTVGLHNVYNATATLAVLLLEGVELPEATSWLETIELPPGRMERIEGPGFDVLIDYAHSPDALAKVLTACRMLGSGTLRLVFGAGGNKDEAKRPEMGEVASRHADCIYLTSDNPRDEDPEAIMDMIATGIDREVVRISDRRQAIAAALDDARSGDVVVVAGKGHESYQEVAGVLHPFDDRAVVRELMRALGSSRPTASREESVHP
jgi:UDP-N-acetylmuramoyl-L-alanyl-D-glutamate--2,6-diaminopimelate ligase